MCGGDAFSRYAFAVRHCRLAFGQSDPKTGTDQFAIARLRQFARDGMAYRTTILTFSR
jgi:hypothetical protein